MPRDMTGGTNEGSAFIVAGISLWCQREIFAAGNDSWSVAEFVRIQPRRPNRILTNSLR